MAQRSQVALVKGEDPLHTVTRAVQLLGGIHRFVHPHAQVLIKPNLCLPVAPSVGQTTHPDVIRALIQLVRTANPSRIVIGDSPIAGYSGREVLHETGMAEVARDEDVDLLDFHEDQWIDVPIPDGRGTKRIRLPQTAIRCDTLINVPKLKCHSACMTTLALKNFQGLVHSVDKLYLTHGAPDFHGDPQPGGPPYPRLGLEYALVDLHRVIHGDLHLVDGLIGPQQGWGGYPGLTPGLIVAGSDAVAVDTMATQAMGIDPSLVNMLHIAEDAGIGHSGIDQIEVLGTTLSEVNTHYQMPASFATTQLEEYPEPNLHVITGTACNICLRGAQSAFNRIVDTSRGRVQLMDLEELTVVVGRDAVIPTDYQGKLILYGNCAVRQWSGIHPFENALPCPGCAPAGGILWWQWKQGHIQTVH